MNCINSSPIKQNPTDISTLINPGDFPNKWDALCVLGPTASGKTKFAVELALSFGRIEGSEFIHGAEILSADSRQVYRGMNIGTGKDLGEYEVDFNEYAAKYNYTREIGGSSTMLSGNKIKIPYHLIDIIDAGEKYNIFEYQKDFAKAYAGILERGRIPIICGGSGLYIEAATKGYQLKEVLPCQQLRKDLEPRAMEELIQILTNLKALRGDTPHNNSDFDSKKRAVRGIEICVSELLGERESNQIFELLNISAEAKEEVIGNQKVNSPHGSTTPLVLPQKCHYIALFPEKEIRNARIDARLEARLQEGMIAEVKALLDSGISPEDLIYYGLEYKFITQHLIGELTYDEMKEKLAIAIHQFAKRQMTWFRRMRTHSFFTTI